MPEATHIAFVCPRFPDGRSAGGAEALMRKLAEHSVTHNNRVTFLTTCATDHFTWANALPPGQKRIGALDVHFFPVDEGRNASLFHRIQSRISGGATLTPEEESLWLANSVQSRPLCDHLQQTGARYDRIIVGPYLFGLIISAAAIHPSRTLILPCLHDEPFARLPSVHKMFNQVHGYIFNTEPEQQLAARLYGLTNPRQFIVGMGIDPFVADGERFRKQHKIQTPYILYCGRRELLKGTPLLIDYWWAFRRRTGFDIALILTGSGPVDIPQGAAPYVRDLGFVSEQEKHDAMAGALAFCQPSRYESLSIVALEAWMAGTAVLVHANGEVLPHQCRRSGGGLWFSDYPEFEETLRRLAEDPSTRQSMAASGRNFVHHEYNWEIVEKRLLQAITA